MIGQALLNLRPGAVWGVNGSSYEGIEWHDTVHTKPTEEEVATEVARLIQEQTATEYQRLRKREYPSIGDQLDALFHAGVFPADMAAQIQAIKDKYPKP